MKGEGGGQKNEGVLKPREARKQGGRNYEKY